MTTTALCMQIEPLTSAAVAWKVLKYEAGNHTVPLWSTNLHTTKCFCSYPSNLSTATGRGIEIWNMEDEVYFLTNVSVFMEIFRRFWAAAGQQPAGWELRLIMSSREYLRCAATRVLDLLTCPIVKWRQVLVAGQQISIVASSWD